ncbi:alpha/beta fold hydrolase [Pseudoalteromonas sp. Of11M-6]|uniref:thioesterase II family protein n=1 Tax=Pseudoalteromonas sp. Of11M-6 TaxID=2917754 RepID=UPI001EF6D87D|nr:alpha/beta fold hydrolase [Pseudoalteromonas sp. Of11M-6]MCG7552621.1 alpha/beta fold hydrolase [Pseudoalteromonas sp. Of11M-6]
MLNTTYTNNSACYRIFKARPNASKRLIILPHAGGSASYFRHWANIADSDLEVVVVQYPGRENRMAEPLISDMDRLVGNLATGLKAILNKPYILFGHSMGGGIAYELAERIQAYRYPPPTQLVVSAVEGPSCHHATEVHKAPDEVMLNELKRLNGTEVDLNALPELLEMMLPLLRNDYQLIETYQPNLNAPKLQLPITVMLGSTDTELTYEEAQAWQQVSSQPINIEVYEGGHFYLANHVEAILTHLGTLFPVQKTWLCAP